MKIKLLILFVIGVLGANAQVSEEVSKELSAKIYPNPVREKFFIELVNTGLSKNVEVNIYNFVGKKEFSEKHQVHYKQKYEVSTDKLIKGIYIVEIKYSDKILRKKIVIK